MNFIKVFVTVLSLIILSACGGGGGGDTSQQDPPKQSYGTITGKVSNNADGSPVTGAEVKVGALATTTGSDGTFTISNVPTGSGKVVNVTKRGFADGSRIANVTDNATTRTDVVLLPIAYTATFDPTKDATITVPGSTASVSIPANSLVTGSGSLPVGMVTISITPLDPSSTPQLMPGNYSTSHGTIMESFGAMEVSFTDSTGAALNLASGRTATISIPLAAGATSPPSTVPAFYYNTTTGKWEQDGTLTLAGTPPNRYYTGTVSRFSYWNADLPITTTCISGKVVNTAGAAVANARVEAEGRNYIGTSETYTAADGTFSILVKIGSTVIITAITSEGSSQSEIVTAGTGSSCTGLDTNLVIDSAASAKIILTWGVTPNDLDSHLTGPDPAVSPTARFHIFYRQKGIYNSAPYAALDVDDISSFGPEITTITRFYPGTYRYSVHHFEGSGDIHTSPARVELRLNGRTTIFTPPSPGSTAIGLNTVWQVFELEVSSSGDITIHRLDNYLVNVSVTDVQKMVTGPLEEKYLFSNLPAK